MNKYNINWIIEYVGLKINEVLKANLYEVGLNENEIIRLRNRKNQLRDALSNSGIGDKKAKEYIKSVIRDIIIKNLNYDEADYNKIIFFESIGSLTTRDKFDIILHQFKEHYQNNAIEFIVEKSGLLNRNCTDIGYFLDCDDIDKLFDNEVYDITRKDKEDIIVQRVYSGYRGLGVIDEIRDMKVDGISGGVSGNENDLNSIWIFYKGINIHLRCLCFEDAIELERICMNIYRYGNPGQLSKSKGYVIGEMKDRSRVVVVRPPFAESFAFFVRKFDNIESKSMEELIIDEGKEIPINIIKWIIRGCQVTAVTGAQGAGKTTLLMSIIGFIPPIHTLRIQEMAFELHLREIYPERNILTFRETDYISGQTGLDVQKKTDGVVNILGEVASIEVASYLIQMSQVGSLFTLFTHHAKTTESLIKYMRNSLLSSGLFRDEKIAKEQVVEAIRFDIHMEKNIYGHRFIERISEIVISDNDIGYKINDIVRWEEGKYVFTNNFSQDVKSQIIKHLTKEERNTFIEQFGI